MDGKSNMVCNKASSITDLSPRAPVFLLIAFSAIAFKESFEKVSFAPSISNNLTYCLTKEFLGSSKILISEASSKSSNVDIIGNRPTNSGIKPNFNKSSGSISCNSSPVFLSSLDFTVAPKPI